jgi:hypothetical protein
MKVSRVILLILFSATVLTCIRNAGKISKEYFVSGQDILDFNNIVPDSVLEEYYTSKKFPDGSMKTTYHFTGIDTTGLTLEIQHSITINPDNKSAIRSYHSELRALRLTRSGNHSYTNIPCTALTKSQCNLYQWNIDNVPWGNVFLLRNGNLNSLLIIGGIYFDDQATWNEFVVSQLSTLLNHTTSRSNSIPGD